MELFLISIWLSLLAPGLASDSVPYYVITVPAQMVSPSVEKACITLLNVQGELKLKMELKREERIQLVTEDTIKTTPIYSHCYSFQLLPNIGDLQGVWLFHVSLQGENINIDQTKKILLYRMNHLTFIQTDKPIYKPGQTVNFRVVTLDKTYHALPDKYPLVEIMDPHDNRIGQWLNVTPNQGIADFTFPLAKELPLGEYKIDIPKASSTTFSVSEYVLKRFEIFISAPSEVPLMGENFKIEVCGRYTYGKPVLGSIDLIVCIKEYNFWEKNYLLENVIMFSDENLEDCQQFKELQTDERGCLSRDIDLGFFNISNIKRLQYLGIKSTLRDYTTGQTENEPAFFLFHNFDTMEFVDLPNNYQRGIPFTVKNGSEDRKTDAKGPIPLEWGVPLYLNEKVDGLVEARFPVLPPKVLHQLRTGLKVTDKKNEPKVNETVFLVVGFENEDVNVTSVTNEKGLATFTMDTTTWEDMVSVMAKFSLEEEISRQLVYSWLYPFYSETNSFLNVETTTDDPSCDTDQSVNVEYYINKNALDPQSQHLSFFFLVLNMGIISSGEYKLDITEQSPGPVVQGSFSLKIPKKIEYSPAVTFLVFTVLLNGDVAASKKEIKFPICLKNKVQLQFAKEKVQPGETVNLEVRAESGSLCSVRSVDKGLHTAHKNVMLPSEMIEMISGDLTVNKRGFPYAIEDFEKYPCLKNKKEDSTTNEAPWYQNEADVYTLFKETNLKVFTNTKIRKPVVCSLSDHTKRISIKNQNTVALETSLYSGTNKKDTKVPTIRRFFPETWLYELVSVGPQGHTVLNLTTPDTITKWVTDAFCLGTSGFGEIKDAELTTFKPYFIDLIVPNSVVQGEIFTIQALVFNYMKECLMVFVSLSDLGDYSALKNREKSGCICADQSITFNWNVTAFKLGGIKVHVSSASVQLDGGCTDKFYKLGKDHKEDNIEKTVLVKPLGILEEKTQMSLLCPEGNSIRREVFLNVPDQFVPGTEQAHITILGDLRAGHLANFGNSLKYPSGCGENNLVEFIPIVYTVKYVESIKQLRPEIRTRALTVLTTGELNEQDYVIHSLDSVEGYQRQLMFKNDNGSYSIFPGSQGSAWLTAFTIKSFIHAQDLIYIQEKHIEDSVRWLSSLQLPNGCFENTGTIFNNYLMVLQEITSLKQH